MTTGKTEQLIDAYFERLIPDIRRLAAAFPDDSIELPSGRTVRAAEAEAALRADMVKKSPAQQILHMTARAFLGERNG